MNENQTPVIVTQIICAIAILVIGGFALAGQNAKIDANTQSIQNNEVDEQNIIDKVLEGIDIPEMPEMPDTSGNIDKVLFNQCNEVLKNTAENDVIDEVIDEDELEEFIEDEIENFDEFVVGHFPTLNPDDTEVVVEVLGYCNIWGTEFGDEEEDKEATVYLVYKFRYEDDEDNDEHKDKVYVIGKVKYDEDDLNDIKDIDLTYTLEKPEAL